MRQAKPGRPATVRSTALSSAITRRPVEGSSKYHNRKITLDGESFDSMKEATRWTELKLLQRTGEIYDLQRQVPFVILPVQKDENGKVIEREVKYVADFTYRERSNHKLVVEDVKSEITKTPVYKLKKKLLLYRHGLRIKEV